MNTKFIFNDSHSHADALNSLFRGATGIDCVMAFAKQSGLRQIITALKRRVTMNARVRFIVGLSFYQTEPSLLNELLQLSDAHANVELHINHSPNRTFHPKIYAFTYPDRTSLVIGSANLTKGGLKNNWEASCLIPELDESSKKSLEIYIQGLVNDKCTSRAKREDIDEYDKEYKLQRARLQLIKKQSQDKISDFKGAGIQILKQYLHEMRSDMSKQGFSAQLRHRRMNRRDALEKIQSLARTGRLSSERFLIKYEELIRLFHSGGLHRGKTIVSQHPVEFQRALKDILTIKSNRDPEAAFETLLHHFLHIPNAGINVMTEVLCAIDPKQYAVMNQNAVFGLALADSPVFPARPSKRNISAQTYAEFCRCASVLKNKLELANFNELDMLLNYVYWIYSKEKGRSAKRKPSSTKE